MESELKKCFELERGGGNCWWTEALMLVVVFNSDDTIKVDKGNDSVKDGLLQI